MVQYQLDGLGTSRTPARHAPMGPFFVFLFLFSSEGLSNILRLEEEQESMIQSHKLEGIPAFLCGQQSHLFRVVRE